MTKGYVLDAGVLQGINKEKPPNTPLRKWLAEEHAKGARLASIREVMAECIDVPAHVLDELGVRIEPTMRPAGSSELLDAFSDHPRSVGWRTDPLRRADRMVFAHAIARRYDIVTTDQAMKDKSFREFLTRLGRLPDSKLPAWHIPEIIILKRGLSH
jgi:hypothetical protein